jgi:hypothetical protein
MQSLGRVITTSGAGGVFFLITFLMSLATSLGFIVFIVAHWKLMRAHQGISNMLEVIAERLRSRAS